MTLPVDETQEINPYINKYVFSKFLSEQIVEYYSKKVPSIVVRLSNIYGYTKLIRPDLVPTIMQSVFQKNKTSIWNNEPKRDFIFTEDAADAVLKIINTDYKGIINLGTGQMNSIKKITDIIEEISGKKIYSENEPVSGPMEFVTDISKIKNITGWSPKFSIEEGIKKTYEIMKQYNQS